MNHITGLKVQNESLNHRLNDALMEKQGLNKELTALKKKHEKLVLANIVVERQLEDNQDVIDDHCNNCIYDGTQGCVPCDLNQLRS